MHDRISLLGEGVKHHISRFKNWGGGFRSASDSRRTFGMRSGKCWLPFFIWLTAVWIVGSHPLFASIPDPFRPVRVHVETSQIVYIPYGAFGFGATACTYDSRDNLSYDAAGNTTQVVLSVKGQTFTMVCHYDDENRLLGVTRLRNGTQGGSVTTSVVQLEYDGLGRLLRITDNGNVRRLVRDGADPLARPLVETDASGNTTRWFVWANGKLLAQVESNGTSRVVLADELGRTLALTDGSGALTDEYAYHPYGRLIAHSGAAATPFTWLGAYGVWDAGNGLYLMRHRAYDANLMRFLQPDPIGMDGGWNLYALASGSPLAWIDALGLCPEDPRSWFAPAPSRTPAYSGPVLTTPQRLNEQRQAAEFLRTLGTQITSPEIARGVAADFIFAIPGAVAGGFIDDAVRGAAGFFRGAARGTTIKYPPNRGFIPGEGNPSSVLPGTVVDRYGGAGGSFLSPQGTPAAARSLAPGVETRPLNAYEVVRPFEVDAGRAAPWFGQPGQGMQYDLGTRTVQDLLNSGHLRPLQ